MHLLQWDAQDPAGCADDGGQIGALAGEQTDLAKKVARAVGRDNEFVRVRVMFGDSDFALEEHDQVIGRISIAKQHIADRDALLGPIAA